MKFKEIPMFIRVLLFPAAVKKAIKDEKRWQLVRLHNGEAGERLARKHNDPESVNEILNMGFDTFDADMMINAARGTGTDPVVFARECMKSRRLGGPGAFKVH